MGIKSCISHIINLPWTQTELCRILAKFTHEEKILILEVRLTVRFTNLDHIIRIQITQMGSILEHFMWGCTLLEDFFLTHSGGAFICLSHASGVNNIFLKFSFVFCEKVCPITCHESHVSNVGQVVWWKTMATNCPFAVPLTWISIKGDFLPWESHTKALQVFRYVQPLHQLN